MMLARCCSLIERKPLYELVCTTATAAFCVIGGQEIAEAFSLAGLPVPNTSFSDVFEGTQLWPGATHPNHRLPGEGDGMCNGV